MARQVGIRSNTGEEIKGPLTLLSDKAHEIGRVIGEHSVQSGWDPSAYMSDLDAAEGTAYQVEGPATFALNILRNAGLRTKELLGATEHSGYAALSESLHTSDRTRQS